MPNTFLPLRTIREAAGLSRIELAQRSGVGLSTLYMIEDGLLDSRISTLLKLANALKVRPERLLSMDSGIPENAGRPPG